MTTIPTQTDRAALRAIFAAIRETADEIGTKAINALAPSADEDYAVLRGSLSDINSLRFKLGALIDAAAKL